METIFSPTQYVRNVETGPLTELISKLPPNMYLEKEFSTQISVKAPGKFVPVRNLNEYISPFSRCFVYLTNFQNVDIFPPSFPIMIRHHIPALIRINGWHPLIRWYSKRLNITGRDLLSTSHKCPYSTLHKDYLDDGFCTTFDTVTFPAKAKPWNCELTIALYPPLHIFLDFNVKNLLKFPSIWHPRTYNKNFPTITKVFHAWIMDPILESQWRPDHIVQWKLKTLSVPGSKRLAHDVFFLMKTSKIVISGNELTDIISIKVPHLCKVTFDSVNECKHVPREFEIDRKLWEMGDLDVLYTAMNYRWQNRWGIKYLRDTRVFYEMNFEKHFSLCENYISNKGYWVNLPFASVHDRVVHAITHVWLSTLGNITYSSETNFNLVGDICSGGKVYPSTTSRELYPVPPDVSFGFEFDLEDSSVVQKMPDHLNSLRYFIFSGAVEANISPATLILKDYNGTRQNQYSLHVPPHFENWYNNYGPEGADVISEPLRLRNAVMRHSFMQKRNFSSKDMEQLQLLVDKTKLLPTMLDIVKNVAEDMIPSYLNSTQLSKRIKDINGHIGFNNRVFQYFIKWQKKSQLEILSTCNRTSLIAPDYLTQSLAFTVTNHIGRKRDVYIGKEVLYQRDFSIKLGGFVNLAVIKRFRHMTESGIADFWVRIFRHDTLYHEYDSENELKEPTMTGNILVVFSLFLVGIGVAICGFLIETRTQMYRFLKFVVISLFQTTRLQVIKQFRRLCRLFSM
ncbi:unnamed protein product [Orchesella dallaii]|uniref:Uncharacterized protein n=1 Tax=Orchesella dallaii TaxID=48710 RepID=A0ABP1S469_9HEXA